MKKEFQQRLLRHLDFLEIEIKDYAKFKDLKQNDYLTDIDKRRNVEKWIENIINSSIDISKIVLTLEGINLPDNYKGIVALISAVKDFSTIESETLSKWVKFRNIVVHEYLDIRWSSIRKFIDRTGPYYRCLLESAKEYLEKRLQA